MSKPNPTGVSRKPDAVLDCLTHEVHFADGVEITGDKCEFYLVPPPQPRDDEMVSVSREALEFWQRILADGSTKTSSGLPVTVLEMIDTNQAIASEMRKIVATQPAATTKDGLDDECAACHRTKREHRSGYSASRCNFVAAPKDEGSNQCSMGVGCDEAGVCYASANGRPDYCPKNTPPAGTTTEDEAWSALISAVAMAKMKLMNTNPDPAGALEYLAKVSDALDVLCTTTTSHENDTVEADFVDTVLDYLFKIGGKGCAAYKSATRFMLERRRLLSGSMDKQPRVHSAAYIDPEFGYQERDPMNTPDYRMQQDKKVDSP